MIHVRGFKSVAVGLEHDCKFGLGIGDVGPQELITDKRVDDTWVSKL